MKLISSQLAELFYLLLNSLLCIEAADYLRELGLVVG